MLENHKFQHLTGPQGWDGGKQKEDAVKLVENYKCQHPTRPHGRGGGCGRGRGHQGANMYTQVGPNISAPK